MSKLEIGDKIRFLNATGGGRVVKLMKDSQVMVRREDGFDVPVPVKECVLVEKALSGSVKAPTGIFDEKDVAEEHIKRIDVPINGKKAIPGVYFGIVRKDAEDKEEFKFYLINDSQYDLFYVFSYQSFDDYRFIDGDKLEADTKVYLSDLMSEKLGKIRAFDIQLIFYQQGIFDRQRAVECAIPVNVRRLYTENAYQLTDYHDERIILYQIRQSENLDSIKVDAKKVIRDKEENNIELNRKTQYKPGRERIAPPREIDLHINKLVENVVGMGNHEILSIQMNKFHDEMKLAFLRKERHIIFIHGIGNGTLKREMMGSVKKDYPQCSPEDAPFNIYGMGATLIKIPQNL